MSLAPSQSLLAERGRYAVSIAPDAIRRAIDTEQYATLFLCGFETALRQGRRDAQRLYCELLGMVGANDRAMELALRALGVSLEIAQQAVGAYREIEHLDAAQRGALCLEGAKEYYATLGKRVVVLEEATGMEANGHAEG